MDDAESLSRAIHEPITLCAYKASWPSMFEEERSRLFRVFPDDFLAIEHIGSTAVPGLSAKPVIDILAGVDSMVCADILMEPLCHAGYATSMAYNASLSDRRWLMRYAQGRRTHHLHLVVFESTLWQQRLAFRDILRANGELATRYAHDKLKWSKEFRADREAYTAAKSNFIGRVLSGTW
ncbi:GrpB family protein [Vreelandella sp. EE27]